VNARNRRVLIVEDELLIAMLMQTIVSAAGYATSGPVGTVEEALFLARFESLDAALLDIRLTGGAESYAVADDQAQRGIPFGFVTSEPADQVAAPHHQRPVLAKPFFAEEVEHLLLRLAGLAVSPVEHRPPLPSKEDHPAAPDLDPEPLKRG
jgi:CheY-like chemotaxis protein